MHGHHISNVYRKNNETNIHFLKLIWHQSERCLRICLFVNSHLSGEEQLRHKISPMPSRNYNKHYRSLFTERSKIFLVLFFNLFFALCEKNQFCVN
jgi:hypothetical protein